jgi:hypothetical protein
MFQYHTFCKRVANGAIPLKRILKTGDDRICCASEFILSNPTHLLLPLQFALAALVKPEFDASTSRCTDRNEVGTKGSKGRCKSCLVM